MVSATAAGPLPSTTQTTVGAVEVGSCGDTKTAPSGPSAAVTAPAENGTGIGALTENGPDVGAGGEAVVVVVEGVVAAGPERGAGRAGSTSVDRVPGCRTPRGGKCCGCEGETGWHQASSGAAHGGQYGGRRRRLRSPHGHHT